MAATEGIRIGRFVARVVPPGGLLYHGIRHDFTREPSSYEGKSVTIEIFDSRYEGSPLGQFVSSYRAETLADMTSGGRLSLHGDVPAWTLTVEETVALRDLARSVVKS